MFPAPNKLRAKLKSGQYVTGTAIYSYSPNMVEAAALSGIDFVRIDSEHAWRRDDSMDHMVRAALLAGVTPLIRIDRDDPYLPRKALEIGAGGVIVSNILNVAEARAVVDAARFPPIGSRGIGTLSLAGQWGRVGEQEWVDWSNVEPMVGIMIESVEAVEDIENIMEVDGIDFALFGPADFGQSVGSRDVQVISAARHAALQRTARAAHAAGKHMMYGAGLGDQAIADAMTLGVDMIELSHDVVMVRTLLSEKLARLATARSAPL